MSRLSHISSFALFLTALSGLDTSLQAQTLPAQVREQAMRESRPDSQRELYDDSQVAARYWYESRNPKNIPAMDEALEKLLPVANKLAPQVNDFQSWEAAQKVKPYHTAGAVLLAKAYTLLYYGDVKNAAPAIELIENKFRYAMVLYDDRNVLWVRERLRFHEHACMLYAAMSLKVVGRMKFPAERDEFDGPQQGIALENMAVLRLKEGNIERLEHFFTGINQSGLQTSSGEWAIHIVLNAMKPVNWEDHAKAAWEEIYQAIKLWQKTKPDSVFAKLAESRFAYHHAQFAMRNGGQASYPEYRESAEHGLELIHTIPKNSPAWYETTVGLMVLNGRKAVEFAPVFQEGLRKYPEYAPLIQALCGGLVEGGEQSRELCAGIIDELAGETYGGVAAQVLRAMLYSGDLGALQPRLNMDNVEKVIRMAVVQWPHSYKLRSDLGLLAVKLGRRDLARDIMKNMRRNWSRATWRGKEDMAIALSASDYSKPEPKVRKPGFSTL